MNNQVIESLAGNIVANARDQVVQTWGTGCANRLGSTIFKAIHAQHVLLALTGYLKVDKLSDEESRALVIATWDRLAKEGK